MQARRNLRSQIERQSLEINENFLSSFKEVKEAFDQVYDEISGMSKSIQDMMGRLQNAKTQTKHLIEQTNSLRDAGVKNDMQLKVTEAFLSAFQLNTDELMALYGEKNRKDSPVGVEIFGALDRVQKIHNDCKILMQSGHQNLALDIMEQMTLHQV